MHPLYALTRVWLSMSFIPALTTKVVQPPTSSSALVPTMKVVEVGNPGRWSDEESVQINFNEFSLLDHQPDDAIFSPTFSCHGLQWCLKLYPGGETSDDVNEEDGPSSSMYLHIVQDSMKQNELKAKFSIDFPNVKDGPVLGTDHVFTADGSTGLGWSQIETRRAILDSWCIKDALTVIVKIQVYTNKAKSWAPKKTLQKDTLSLILKGAFDDIAFSVGQGDSQERMGANRAILTTRAPGMKSIIELASQVAASNTANNFMRPQHSAINGRSMPTIPLPDVNPQYFRTMLSFIQTDDTSFLDNVDDKLQIQELLTMANRFGCWKLKLSIETKLIEALLNFETSIDLLMFADTHRCFMLKESAMDVLTQRAFGKHKDADKLFESARLSNEVLRKLVGKPEDIDEKYSAMSIVELYEALEKQGVELESDGDRATLVQQLKGEPKKPVMPSLKQQKVEPMPVQPMAAEPISVVANEMFRIM